MAQGKKAVDLTPEALEALAVMHPSNEEIAAYFKVSRQTVQRYLRKKPFAEAFARGKDMRDISLKRAQWRAGVEKGNVVMLIWLGKQVLGQTDKAAMEHSGPDGGAIEHRQIDAPPRPASYSDWLEQTAGSRLDQVFGEMAGSNGTNGHEAHGTGST